MKQHKIINDIKNICFSDNCIQSCLLIGSFGRGDATVKSDIDIQIIVNNDFHVNSLIDNIHKSLKEIIKYSFFIEDKNKFVCYLFDDYILCEIFVCRDIKEINKYFLGSEINTISNAILFDKTKQLDKYLEIIKTPYNSNKFDNRLLDIQKNIKEFLYRFESCSSAHAKSDGYKFYLLYNNALNCLVRFIYWANDGMDYSYLPTNFLTRYGYKINFLELDGSMFLPRGNELKQKLLVKFYDSLNSIKQSYKIEIDLSGIRKFCEDIYHRDYFWNFRDIGTYNNFIKLGVIFRSTTMTSYQNDSLFIPLMKNKNITQIIDLRTIEEVAENPYNNVIINNFKYTNFPVDPRVQSEEFISKYSNGSNVEIAYKYYAIECKKQIHDIMLSLIENSGASLIHCVAGRDRTGSIITLLHLLSGTETPNIINDYLASGQDTNENDILIFLRLIEDSGGIIHFLKSCDLSDSEISQIKNKITIN